MLNSNIALNTGLIEAGGGSAVAFPVVWGSTDCSQLDHQWRFPDVVVAADVIYHRELMTPLLDVMTCLGRALFLHLAVPFAAGICVLWC